MAAFNSDAYQDRFGSALSALAGADIASQGGALSDPNQAGSGDIDYDQENNSAKQNSQGGGANLPGPWQMFRGSPSPPGPSMGGGKGQQGPSPQSSGAFYDPNGPHQSPPVYDAVDQMTDAQVRAHEKAHDDAIAPGKDDHGHPDMQSVWNSTFKQKLQERSEQAGLDEATASKAMSPTWRDKVSMFLDAANRASSIRAMNPAMSQGDTWAVATRGALDGWMAHAQGQHDGYLAQQKAIRDQASKDADAAVKRSTDTFGLIQKADELKRKQDEDAEKKRHNIATEANAAAANKNKAASEGRAAAKGDLVTGDDGYMYRVDSSGKAIAVKDGDGNPVKGTKTGVNAPKTDSLSTKDAQTAWEKYLSDYKKTAKGSIGDLGKAQKVVEQEAKAAFKNANPNAYKSVFGDEPDVSAPPQEPAKKKPPGIFAQ